jgi:hypothetical protein
MNKRQRNIVARLSRGAANHLFMRPYENESKIPRQRSMGVVVPVATAILPFRGDRDCRDRVFSPGSIAEGKRRHGDRRSKTAANSFISNEGAGNIMFFVLVGKRVRPSRLTSRICGESSK